jgi:CxxC motif-containing protein (DUF1111 family)
MNAKVIQQKAVAFLVRRGMGKRQAAKHLRKCTQDEIAALAGVAASPPVVVQVPATPPVVENSLFPEMADPVEAVEWDGDDLDSQAGGELQEPPDEEE